ncbi:MAG TPA: hypothetical protein VFS46_05645 [Nitrososphaera sp.]|nr:hypothetical protein [Nitrososphaera sp.]
MSAVLESSSRHLGESARNIEEIRSILHWARLPERGRLPTLFWTTKKKSPGRWAGWSTIYQ